MTGSKRVLLLLPAAGYRNEDFLAAARRLNVEVIAAANHCRRLAPLWGLDPLLAVPFDCPEIAAEILLDRLPTAPDAVLALEDSGLELAALLRERWGLPGNPLAAVRPLRDKLAFRRLQQAGGLRCPGFHHLPGDADPAVLLPRLEPPVVVKARRLSTSRGIIRADDPAAFLAAVSRVRRIQREAERDAEALGLVVEAFIPGMEYALEGMLQQGRLRTLALFDKPDPLDGPYFEETLYVTPSRLAPEVQAQIRQAVERACALAGLAEGPVHAEMRVNGEGVWLLEVAARSIGGLCARTLRHALGMSLEELILRQALGMALPQAEGRGAAGVMMIPIPRHGIYRGVRNLEAALAQPGVSDIRITAEPGQIVAPPPEGASYLGFIFSRAERPAEAEMALRLAHRLLDFDIAPAAALAPAEESAG